MNVQKIADKFKVDLDEAAVIAEAAQSNTLDQIDDDLFFVLYDFYIDNGEIPYDVASTGDPYDWIATKLVEELGTA